MSTICPSMPSRYATSHARTLAPMPAHPLCRPHRPGRHRPLPLQGHRRRRRQAVHPGCAPTAGWLARWLARWLLAGCGGGVNAGRPAGPPMPLWAAGPSVLRMSGAHAAGGAASAGAAPPLPAGAPTCEPTAGACSDVPRRAQDADAGGGVVHGAGCAWLAAWVFYCQGAVGHGVVGAGRRQASPGPTLSGECHYNCCRRRRCCCSPVPLV